MKKLILVGVLMVALLAVLPSLAAGSSWTLVTEEGSEQVEDILRAESRAGFVVEMFEIGDLTFAILGGVSETEANRIARDPRTSIIERSDEELFKFPEREYPGNPADYAWWPHRNVTQTRRGADGNFDFFWSQEASFPAYIFVVDSGINRYDRQITWDRIHDSLRGGGSDCDDHGTHVAGIIGHNGTEHFQGLAPRNPLQIVRVLACGRPVPPEFVYDGFSYIYEEAQALRQRSSGRPMPIIINASIGPFSKTETMLINELHKEGVVTVVAAGNDARNACEVFDPSLKAIVVGSIDKDDTISRFSNYGPCVDIYAPGKDILSRGRDLHRPLSMSGTSMAAPHVTATAAILAGALYRCSEKGRSGIRDDDAGRSMCRGLSYYDYVKKVLERSSRQVKQASGEAISILYVGPAMDADPLRRQDFQND